MTATTTPIDEARLNGLLGQAVVEIGATANAALIMIGDRLGLYRALAQDGPPPAAERAQRSEPVDAFGPEWASARAGGGWIGDGDRGRYSRWPEQALLF